MELDLGRTNPIGISGSCLGKMGWDGWDGWPKGALAGRLLAGGALLRVQVTFPLDTEGVEIKDLVGAFSHAGRRTAAQHC